MATTRIMPLHIGKGQMCIRDSVYTVEGNSGDACKIKSYELNYPVSYTHLDVYKRQYSDWHFNRHVTCQKLGEVG